MSITNWFKTFLNWMGVELKVGMSLRSTVEIETDELNRASGFGIVLRGQLLLNEEGNPLFFQTPKDAILYAALNGHGNPLKDPFITIVFQRWETPTKKVYINEVLLSGTD